MRRYPCIILLFGLIQSCHEREVAPVRLAQKPIAIIDSKMNDWLSKNNMPGVSLAISVNGKLVYRKGYGLADKQTGDSVTVDSRFRIASVSKLITSAAVMILLEKGKLSLTDRVFGNQGILGTSYGMPPYETYVTDITVSDLLHHTAGGWGQKNDPTFWDNKLTRKEVIDLTLNTIPIEAKPGTRFDYSNFGYVLLAGIIQKRSGKSYQQFVKDEIFSKIDADHTTIGGMSLAERQPGEVRYYGQEPSNYDFANLARAEGAYGWVSTPTDLLRFATAVDSLPTRPDLLAPQTIQQMITTTPASFGFGTWHFGCGWVVEGGEWFWWGTLPGTFAFLYRNSNGICVAAASNGKSARDGYDLNSFLNILNFITSDKTITWQVIDQF